MARARPVWAITASRLASALVSTASVATTASVVLVRGLALVTESNPPAGSDGGRPRPPYSPSRSNGAAQNQGPSPVTTLPAALTAASAPTVNPSQTADAEPRPPLRLTVVAPRPAPTLPSAKATPAAAAA